MFTPLDLVEQMLDKLPSHVWSNPSLTWFDPTVGIGNFMVCIYYRLMEGLKDAIVCEEERSRHIITNMLYMSELNSKNVLICRRIFGEDVNIHEGDTLVFEPLHEEFGLEKFDIVVGNPPYQDATTGKRDGGYGGRSLWDQFVKKALQHWIANDGYLCFVHPSHWRKPEHDLWTMMTSKQMIHLDIHSKKQGTRVFRAATRFDWYVIKNCPYTQRTKVRDEEGVLWDIDLREWKFLPNGAYELMELLFDFTDNGNTFDVLHSYSIYDTRKSYVKKDEIEGYKYKVIHNMTKNGIGFVYTNDPTKGHFGDKKVILSFGEFQYPVNDGNGEYGMSQITYGLRIDTKEEGDAIIEAMNSTAFKRVLTLTKWNVFNTEWRMFKYLKKNFMEYLK